MLQIFGKTKVKSFGLDVSDNGIKVMELSPRNHGLFPTAYSEVPLAQNLILNHMISNEDKLADNIKRAVSAAKHIDTEYVTASIPEAKSFVRVLKLPKMPEDELAGAVPFEIEQNIPVPIEMVYMDWQILREAKEGLEVMVTATPKDYVDSLVSTLKIAGLVPVAMELESQAMSRSLISKDDNERTVLIVDISSVQTSFVIVEHGHVEYTSSISVAGNAFTESISRNLGMSMADAENAKRQQGLVADIRKGNIRQAILPLLDNIIEEIRNVARFHEEHSPEHSEIAEVILSGGSAKLPGIADYVSARLNLMNRSMHQVLLGNPWINIADETRVKLPLTPIEALSYCTVAGLAIRGANYEEN